jgi:hypothetical protein
MAIRVISPVNKDAIRKIRERSDAARAEFKMPALDKAAHQDGEETLKSRQKDTAITRMLNRYRLLHDLKALGWDLWVKQGKEREFNILTQKVHEPFDDSQDTSGDVFAGREGGGRGADDGSRERSVKIVQQSTPKPQPASVRQKKGAVRYTGAQRSLGSLVKNHGVHVSLQRLKESLQAGAKSEDKEAKDSI